MLLLDRAGWHTTSELDMPANISPIFLPSRARQLNPVENVWQYLRQNWLSNTVFENYDAIVWYAACRITAMLRAEGRVGEPQGGAAPDGDRRARAKAENEQQD